MIRLTIGNAALTGAGIGVLLGFRDGLATFSANSFANAEQHALAFLVVPIAQWFVLGPVLLLPIAVLGRALRRGSVPLAAGCLTGIATAMAGAGWLEDGLAMMHATDAKPSGGVAALSLSMLLIATATVATATNLALRGALVRWPVTVRRVTVMLVIVGMTACAWTARFLFTQLDPPATRAASARTTPPPPATAPNVLLISIDTLRADELGTLGSERNTTPALDRFARQGVTFEHATSAASWTLPAVTSLLTGRYPRHHGAGAIANRHDPLGRTPLAAGIPTLADAFTAAGYRTKAIVTNPYLFAESGLANGFSAYDNLTFLSEAMLSGRRNGLQFLLDHVAPSLAVGDRGVEVSDRAMRWLAAESSGSDRPFLLWLHYLDPHGPYGNADGSRRKSFRGETTFGAASVGGTIVDGRSPEPVRLRSGEIRLDGREKLAMRALYRSEIAEVDRQVGRVLDALDANGLTQHTIVVVVSDHGEEFWEHGGVEHGHSLYDEIVHVPLFIRWPGHLQAGERVSSIVSGVDLAPTLYELAGLPTDPATDGISLLPLLRGEAVSPRAVLSENLLFAEERVAVRTDDTKLIRWENGKEEAYDLRADPDEQRDLAGVESFLRPLRVALRDFDESHIRAVTPVTFRQAPESALRALGYIH